jgi:hypothetical protein
MMVYEYLFTARFSAFSVAPFCQKKNKFPDFLFDELEPRRYILIEFSGSESEIAMGNKGSVLHHNHTTAALLFHI